MTSFVSSTAMCLWFGAFLVMVALLVNGSIDEARSVSDLLVVLAGVCVGARMYERKHARIERD